MTIGPVPHYGVTPPPPKNLPQTWEEGKILMDCFCYFLNAPVTGRADEIHVSILLNSKPFLFLIQNFFTLLWNSASRYVHYRFYNRLGGVAALGWLRRCKGLWGGGRKWVLERGWRERVMHGRGSGWAWGSGWSGESQRNRREGHCSSPQREGRRKEWMDEWYMWCWRELVICFLNDTILKTKIASLHWGYFALGLCNKGIHMSRITWPFWAPGFSQFLNNTQIKTVRQKVSSARHQGHQGGQACE